jgi:RHS repeat-associated protein
VYDGWNPIAEYSISNNQYSISKTYLWGMDLSGTLQGAGGVGGLLAVTDSTGTYYPTYDGNGNISEYLDSTGAVVAHYEYDPFGKTTVASGAKANDFAHRFSTKPLDPTTGLYYYIFRFYDPNTGRWPSRDPIEEDGGINLHGFVGNDGVNEWDRLGETPGQRSKTLEEAVKIAASEIGLLTRISRFLGQIEYRIALASGNINLIEDVELFVETGEWVEKPGEIDGHFAYARKSFVSERLHGLIQWNGVFGIEFGSYIYCEEKGEDFIQSEYIVGNSLDRDDYGEINGSVISPTQVGEDNGHKVKADLHTHNLGVFRHTISHHGININAMNVSVGDRNTAPASDTDISSKKEGIKYYTAYDGGDFREY